MRHVRQDAIDFHGVPFLLRGRQGRNPGGAVLGIHPAHGGRRVADVATRRSGAELQTQPNDGGIFRSQLARLAGQFDRRLECGGIRLGSRREPDMTKCRRGRQRIGIPGVDERLRGSRSPSLILVRRGCRRAAGRAAGGRREPRQRHRQRERLPASLDHHRLPEIRQWILARGLAAVSPAVMASRMASSTEISSGCIRSRGK